MPLASSGLMSSVTRQAFRVIHSPPNIASTRGLHTQSFAPRAPPQPSSFTFRALNRTKNLFNAFVGHLTTPGTLRSPGPASRSIQSAASRMPTIENNLSLPVRHAISMRMGAPRLPRPPAVPRHIAQVGLGTARNFTTGRPIFQNIVDKIHNIPVTSRAFLEADWDMRTRDDTALAFKLKAQRKESRRGSAARASKVQFHPAAARTTEPAAQAELDKYFAPQVPDVSTTLLIPLAPTPTARVPLPRMFAYDRHPLIPFVELSALHIDTDRHASRVRALFEQLDAHKFGIEARRAKPSAALAVRAFSAFAFRGGLRTPCAASSAKWRRGGASSRKSAQRRPETRTRTPMRRCRTLAPCRIALGWQSST
ncbi:hypothetical protein BJV78DRAFT_131509 [Lactifluus subvellereus]|nr:hypothetical protein BJV78DRAFT_131509 [Lactifluus subvellereus]